MTLHYGPWEARDLNEVAKAGGPPDPPDMELLKLRIGRLEDDTKEIRQVLGRMEPMLARLDTAVQHLAKQAAVDSLVEKVAGLDRRASDLGQRLDTTSSRFDAAVSTALSRVPSWWQVPAVIAGTVALLTGLYAAGKYLSLVT